MKAIHVIGVKVLKKCPKILNPTKAHDVQLNLLDINRTLAWKGCRADFSSVLEPLTGWFKKGVLKQECQAIQVTTYFGFNNFGHILAMKMIFFSKCSKFYVDSETLIKLGEDVDGFEDNSACTCCGSFFQLWKKHLWSGVNVLKKCPKISDPANRHDTQINLFDINGTFA